VAKQVNFESKKSLKHVYKAIDEAKKGVKDKSRVIADSNMHEALTTAIAGAAAGSACTFLALFNHIGVDGIASGLAKAGANISGDRLKRGGIIALIAAAIITIVTLGIVPAIKRSKQRKLDEAKEVALKAALEQYGAIVKEQQIEIGKTKARADYLYANNVVLQAAVRDLSADLGKAV
jgi:hypothetical protein